MAEWLGEALITVQVKPDVRTHAECLAAIEATAWGLLPPELAATATVKPVVLRAGDLPGGGPLVPVPLDCGHDASAYPDEVGRVQNFWCPTCRCLRNPGNGQTGG